MWPLRRSPRMDLRLDPHIRNLWMLVASRWVSPPAPSESSLLPGETHPWSSRPRCWTWPRSQVRRSSRLHLQPATVLTSSSTLSAATMNQLPISRLDPLLGAPARYPCWYPRGLNPSPSTRHLIGWDGTLGLTQDLVRRIGPNIEYKWTQVKALNHPHLLISTFNHSHT